MVARRADAAQRTAAAMLLAATTALLVWGGAPRVSRACGPDFSPSLLETRGEALVGVGRGRVALEYPRLTSTTLRRCQPVETRAPGEYGPRRMPEAPDTPDGRLYQRGADALAASELQPSARADAIRAFTAILQLPPQDRAGYSVAAAFMLGRLAAPHGGGWFEQARVLANDGFADPICLAIESLGEQGRQALELGQDDAAVQAYAEQAAADSDSALVSLGMVGRELMDDPQRLQRALQAPVVQALLASMAHASGESWQAGTDDWVNESAATATNVRLLWTMASVPLQRGQDRLAAAAWRAGEYELAEFFAAQSDKALALVVRAKAAIRRGETAQLRERLDAAAHAAAAEDDLRLIAQIEQDRAILALSERRYQDAGAIAVALGDVALATYVVERVLAPDEAKVFLARRDVRLALAHWQQEPTETSEATLAPTPRRPAQQLDRALDVLHGWSTWDKPTLPQLTGVLARRLVRQGRGDEAAPLLPAEQAQRARTYASAMADAGRTHGVDRAQALYRAAQALLPDGMSLIGTELGPDWTIVDGNYEGATDRFSRELPTEVFRAVERIGDPDCRSAWQADDPEAKLCIVSADEAERVAASEPPGRSGGYRYHYRARAAELLLEAAESVPTHTQAYAALLCASYQPVRDRVPSGPINAYALYVRYGAFVPGAFASRSCPEPEFQRARQTPAPRWQWQVQRRMRWVVRDSVAAARTTLAGAEAVANLRWIADLGETIEQWVPWQWREEWGKNADEG